MNKKTIFPPKLKKGDTIGIVAPSRHLDAGQKFKLHRAVQIVEQLGFRVRLGASIDLIDKYGYSAGTPAARAEDIHTFLRDSEIAAIWCAQGGQTANMILDQLEYELFCQYPKLFMGMSDISVLLNAIYHKTGLVTFHAPDPKGYPESHTFASNYSHQEFIDRLVEGRIGQIRKITRWRTVRPGKATGTLLGGNLRCFLKLAGSEYMPDVRGAILLLEDYHIDIPEAMYLLTRLDYMKVFAQISGIVVGYVYGFQHRRNKIAQFEDILLDVSKKYTFPILKINEFGHRVHNTFLPIGGIAQIEVNKQKFVLTEPCLS